MTWHAKGGVVSNMPLPKSELGRSAGIEGHGRLFGKVVECEACGQSVEPQTGLAAIRGSCMDPKDHFQAWVRALTADEDREIGLAFVRDHTVGLQVSFIRDLLTLPEALASYAEATDEHPTEWRTHFVDSGQSRMYRWRLDPNSAIGSDLKKWLACIVMRHGYPIRVTWWRTPGGPMDEQLLFPRPEVSDTCILWGSKSKTSIAFNALTVVTVPVHNHNESSGALAEFERDPGQHEYDLRLCGIRIGYLKLESHVRAAEPKSWHPEGEPPIDTVILFRIHFAHGERLWWTALDTFVTEELERIIGKPADRKGPRDKNDYWTAKEQQVGRRLSTHEEEYMAAEFLMNCTPMIDPKWLPDEDVLAEWDVNLDGSLGWPLSWTWSLQRTSE